MSADKGQTLKMPRNVLLDRTWLPKLAFEISKLSTQVSSQIYGFEIISLEAGGPSGLHDKLQQNNELRGKLYIVHHDDMPNISDQEAQSLELKLARLSESAHVVKAIRSYRARSGGLGDTDDAILGYIFRLLMLSGSMGSTLLVWNTRYELIRALLHAEQIGYEEHEADGLWELVSDPTCFPFDDEGAIGDRRIRAMTLSDPFHEQTDRYESTDNSTEEALWRSYWRKHKNGLRWVGMMGIAILGFAAFIIGNYSSIGMICEDHRYLKSLCEILMGSK